jgi:hypothetical protein
MTLKYVLLNFVPKNEVARNIAYNFAIKLISAGIDTSDKTIPCNTKRNENPSSHLKNDTLIIERRDTKLINIIMSAAIIPYHCVPTTEII